MVYLSIFRPFHAFHFSAVCLFVLVLFVPGFACIHVFCISLILFYFDVTIYIKYFRNSLKINVKHFVLLK